MLSKHGINSARVWPGVELHNARDAESAVQAATRQCLVPPSYAADSSGSDRWHGTIGSSLSHLQLLQNASSRSHSCTWSFVIADDVVLFPDFKQWVSKELFGQLPTRVDFINLAVVRPWGLPVTGSDAKHVSGSLSWPSWSLARSRPSDYVRSPNLLVSGYIARTSQLGSLLSAFMETADWQRSCSIDQVLARVQYALASLGTFESFVVGADVSHLAHCAVSAAEADEWAERFPKRHRACTLVHPEVYRQGSRSHHRRLSVSKQPGAVVKSIRPPGCNHSFVVPHDRVVTRGGVLTTLPFSATPDATTAPRHHLASWTHTGHCHSHSTEQSLR